MGGPLIEQRPSDGSGCSRSADSDHQLQELYDPRLDDQRPQLWEERTREQARAEKLLKNFDMFRDWDYVPRLPADGGRHWRSCSDGDSDGSDGGCVENDGGCVENDGDVSGYSSADSDTEPTITICSRVNGVFHYIPAQRLLKGTSAAPQRYDVTDTAVG
ncbi:hypothetical protein FJT64_007885 [Amphibalanus amphitrite]|uniref:Uncharacterized protein n=1 Tax=Amphibalanus amphitrite TaxID=1232801 RepID=A0A6A4VSS1_AMPAM|nr:hypothetical protein FJT64_007885 [Amphibalanus amphitrite]